jgi:hypothetical protein
MTALQSQSDILTLTNMDQLCAALIELCTLSDVQLSAPIEESRIVHNVHSTHLRPIEEVPQGFSSEYFSGTQVCFPMRPTVFVCVRPCVCTSVCTSVYVCVCVCVCV